MFASIETFRARAAIRAADLIDLAIEFATLGEYGLEYPELPVNTGRSHHRGPAVRRDASRHRGIPNCPGSVRTRREAPGRSRPSPRRNPVHPDRPARPTGHGAARSGDGSPIRL